MPENKPSEETCPQKTPKKNNRIVLMIAEPEQWGPEDTKARALLKEVYDCHKEILHLASQGDKVGEKCKIRDPKIADPLHGLLKQFPILKKKAIEYLNEKGLTETPYYQRLVLLSVPPTLCNLSCLSDDLTRATYQGQEFKDSCSAFDFSDDDENTPNDPISLCVAVNDYHVSRATLKRAIKDGRIQSYRDPIKPSNSPHRVSRKEVEKYWPKKPVM